MKKLKEEVSERMEEALDGETSTGDELGGGGKNAMIDRVLDQFISRKFLAWVVATIFFAVGTGLSSEDWMMVTAIYIGSQSVVDSVVRWKLPK